MGRHRGDRVRRLSLLGFAFVPAYTTVVGLIGEDVAAYSAALPLAATRQTLLVLIYFAMCIFAGRIGRLYESKAASMAVGIGAIAGCTVSLCSVASSPGDISVPVYMVGLTLASCFGGVAWLMWAELYARMDSHHTMTLFLLAHVLSAGISFLLVNLCGRILALSAATALAVAAAILPEAALAYLRDAPYAHGEELAERSRFPVAPFVLMFVFTLANIIARCTLPANARGYATAGVVIVCAVALAMTVATGGKAPSTWHLASTAFLLTIAGLLAMPIGTTGWGTASSMLTNGGYALFSTYLWVTLCSVSFRYGTSALLLFSAARLAGTSGGLVGSALTAASAPFGANGTEISAALCVLGLAACFVVFVGKGGSDVTWGVAKAADEAAMERPPTADQIESACRSRIARDCGLTRREEDVLVLLARGMTASQIETELYVSNATVKTHTQSVYRKLGVHSRSELIAYVTKTARPSRLG